MGILLVIFMESKLDKYYTPNPLPQTFDEEVKSKFLPGNCFYDIDMENLIKGFASLKKSFDVIEKRFNRFETIQISTSILEYELKQVMLKKHPEAFYRFCSGDIDIYIFAVKKGTYSIRVNGFDILDSSFKDDFEVNFEYDPKSSFFSADYKHHTTDIDSISMTFNRIVFEITGGKNGLF